MSKRKIEKPKVFISYAWADEEYQNQVLAFVSQLVSDGIDVVFDKWDLTEGNDTNAFMEKCATDPEITNVLMLLDPVYAAKADGHSGGVGTETQIISAKVYQEVTQDKFIPVVMKRDSEGKVCKPTYLQGRLHFDLSVPDEYDQTYQRLVKKLYGEEVYSKPQLGKKPEWVEKTIIIDTKTITTFNTLKDHQAVEVKTELFSTYLDEISGEFLGYINKSIAGSIKPDEYIVLYDETSPIRKKYLQLIKYDLYVKDSHKEIARFFENIINKVPQNGGHRSDIVKIRIHELFLYTIAYYLKNRNYMAIGYLLGKTYYDNAHSNYDYGAENYKMFYSGMFHQNLDAAIKSRDNKRYYTGTGAYWMETLASDFCSKEELILADLICYNYSFYGNTNKTDWPWFPITYVYDNEYKSALGQMVRKMSSKEFAQEILPLFGYDTIDDFKARIKMVEDDKSNQYRETRYPEAFESAHLIRDFIKAEDVGKYR